MGFYFRFGSLLGVFSFERANFLVLNDNSNDFIIMLFVVLIEVLYILLNFYIEIIIIFYCVFY